MNRILSRAITPLMLVHAAFAQSNQAPKASAVPITISPANRQRAEAIRQKVEKDFKLPFMDLHIRNLEEGHYAQFTLSPKVSLDEIFQVTQKVMLSGSKKYKFPPVSVGKKILIDLEGDIGTLELTCKRKPNSISCTTPMLGQYVASAPRWNTEILHLRQ